MTAVPATIPAPARSTSTALTASPQTASQSGTTNAAGEFRYYPGETIDFYVGDLLLAKDIPAQEHVTLLEFFPDIRNELKTPLIDDEALEPTARGRSTYDRVALNNLGRFLIALNWTGNVREGIDIREQVIQQLNAALPDLSAAIDFTVSEPEFTAWAVLPPNQLLARSVSILKTALSATRRPLRKK